MILMLIALASIGFMAAGMVFTLSWLTKGRIPRYFATIAAGLAMLGFIIWDDYSWFDRSAGGLPDVVQVTEAYESGNPLKPWSMFWPRIGRYEAVNLTSLSRNDVAPDMVIAETLVVARQSGSRRMMQIFDCAGGRRALLTRESNFSPEAGFENLDWITAPEGAGGETFRVVCARE